MIRKTTIFIFSVFFCSRCFFSVNAATVDNFGFNSGVLSAEGLCGGYKVSIQLSQHDEILYSGETGCQNGSFVFEDNLSEWKMPDGKYLMTAYDANSPLSNPSEQKEILIENNVVLLEEETQELFSDEPEPDTNLNFWNKIIGFFSQWIHSAILVFRELVTEKITTSELCIGDICVLENDLKGFLKNKNKNDENLIEDSAQDDNKQSEEARHSDAQKGTRNNEDTQDESEETNVQ